MTTTAAKAQVALVISAILAGLTAVEALVAADSQLRTILVIVGAFLTAAATTAGVYVVPNQPKPLPAPPPAQ